MKYARQVQGALDRLDQNLLGLNRLVKEGKQQEAIEFMENGPLKEAYEELQNIITLSQVNPLGASGTQNIGNI